MSLWPSSQSRSLWSSGGRCVLRQAGGLRSQPAATSPVLGCAIEIDTLHRWQTPHWVATCGVRRESRGLQSPLSLGREETRATPCSHRDCRQHPPGARGYRDGDPVTSTRTARWPVWEVSGPGQGQRATPISPVVTAVAKCLRQGFPLWAHGVPSS